MLPCLPHEPPRQCRAARGLVFRCAENQKPILPEFPNRHPWNVGFLGRAKRAQESRPPAAGRGQTQPTTDVTWPSERAQKPDPRDAGNSRRSCIGGLGAFTAVVRSPWRFSGAAGQLRPARVCGGNATCAILLGS